MTEIPKLPQLKNIRMLLLDVDGVLTDGSIIYNENGDEIKVFNARDGLGIRLLQKAGIHVGIVTGRSSQALLHRCRNLGIELVYDDVRDKSAVLDEILKQLKISAQEIAFVGDDLIDLPVMRRVGLPIAVADAHELVMESALWTTAARGGQGAVREVCEALLKAQKKWRPLLEEFKWLEKEKN
jgi:3-deoxy-D-manno-octulosonate 8-phosphate phosphatase (KDO 8-P phosphatase)